MIGENSHARNKAIRSLADKFYECVNLSDLGCLDSVMNTVNVMAKRPLHCFSRVTLMLSITVSYKYTA